MSLNYAINCVGFVNATNFIRIFVGIVCRMLKAGLKTKCWVIPFKLMVKFDDRISVSHKLYC